MRAPPPPEAALPQLARAGLSAQEGVGQAGGCAHLLDDPAHPRLAACPRTPPQSLHPPTLLAPAHPTHPLPAVYHVTEAGWTKVRGEDVGELHYHYYPKPEDHPTNSIDPLAA